MTHVIDKTTGAASSPKLTEESITMKLQRKSVSATSLAAAPAVGFAVLAAPSAVAAPATNLVGDGCSAYAQQVPTGPGSVAGMANDPVAIAASNNPMLTTLPSALSGKLNPQVNLVDTLDNGQYTVFAPTDAAFSKLPAATINELKTNSDMLKRILTYHGVPGQLSPAQVDGSHNSV